ncbi:hypothetical protein D3C81_1289260 [compost metagenome]
MQITNIELCQFIRGGAQALGEDFKYCSAYHQMAAAKGVLPDLPALLQTQRKLNTQGMLRIQPLKGTTDREGVSVQREPIGLQLQF